MNQKSVNLCFGETMQLMHGVSAGAQIAYDTSAKAQDRRLEAQARNREADELLAEMKRKRGNN